MRLDSVQIGVADLASAGREYALVFGREPATVLGGASRFQLCRGAVELEAGAPGVHSLRFVPEANEAPTWPLDPAAFNGLDIRISNPIDAPAFQSAAEAVDAIDHVVINTPDLDRAIGLWRDRLGVRLALDREFPQRGLRMCFFRSAGMTLEFVGSLPAPRERDGPDRFYGLAYQVTDLTRCRTRLLQAGIDVSEVRRGNKTGTVVATVRSHTSSVPTLLIEEVAR